MNIKHGLGRARALFHHLARLDARLYEFPYRLGF